MKGKSLSVSRQRLKYIASDVTATFVAFFLFNIFRYCLLYTKGFPEIHDDISPLLEFLIQPKLLWEQALIPSFAIFLYWISGYYEVPFGKSRLKELLTTLNSALLSTIFIYLALLTNDQVGRRLFNWAIILALFLLLFICVYIGRLSITRYAIRQMKRRKWTFNTLIVGNSKAARETASKLENARINLGYQVCGFVALPGEDQVSDGKNVYCLNELSNICRRLNIDQIVISLQKPDEAETLHLLYTLFDLNIPIRIEPAILAYVTSAIHMEDIFAEPFIDLTRPAVSNSQQIIKRICDVIVSSLALILLSPFALLIAIAIKRDSPGSVFYSQERVGRHHHIFRIHKFRSMRSDAEASGPQLSSDNDTRITTVGRFLRKYRIDELPQFWNVLKGDMSLVGPRPERDYYVRQIIADAPYYTLVHQVRPGITSWGMVKYGYASSLPEMILRTRYDLLYLSNMSLVLDIKILMYTIKTVVGGKGK